MPSATPVPAPPAPAVTALVPDAEEHVVHVAASYLVQSRDTLQGIAAQYSLSPVELLLANEKVVRDAYEGRGQHRRYQQALDKLDQVERNWVQQLLRQDCWDRRDVARMAGLSQKAGYDFGQLDAGEEHLIGATLQLPLTDDAPASVAEALTVVEGDTVAIVVDEDPDCAECAEAARQFAQAVRVAGKTVSAIVYFGDGTWTTFRTGGDRWVVDREEVDNDRFVVMDTIWRAADPHPAGIVVVTRQQGEWRRGWQHMTEGMPPVVVSYLRETKRDPRQLSELAEVTHGVFVQRDEPEQDAGS
ncbi:MAG: LysM peptidoglycan-binding domain-containing protein [Candidatus Andersenbacteria bacterium]